MIGALLSRGAILAAPDLQHEDVPVPAWGGMVRVRTMSGAERDGFRASIPAGGVPVSQFSAALLAATIIDAAGMRLFEVADIEALQAKGAVVLDTLAVVAMRLNGLGDSSAADAVKNSESGQSGDSGSGSPKS